MAGLLEMLMGPRAQTPMQPGQPRGGLQSLLDPSFALPMAAGLMGNQGDAGNFSAGFANAAPFVALRRQKQEEQAQKNQTLEYLRRTNPELAGMVEAGMPVSEAWGTLTKQKFGNADNQETWGMNPTYGTDPETGATVLGVSSNRGNFKRLDTGGFNISSGVEKIDLGTQWGIIDKRNGQIVGYEPKDLRGAESEKAIGKGQGEAGAAYQSMSSKMPGLEKVVGDLDRLSDQATYTWAGRMTDAARRQMGSEPRESAVARQTYISMVDNQILPLLRDTFGAQFTQKEGESLRATLGNPDLHPKEKQAVLKAFIEQKRRDVESLAQQSGQGGGVIDYQDWINQN